MRFFAAFGTQPSIINALEQLVPSGAGSLLAARKNSSNLQPIKPSERPADLAQPTGRIDIIGHDPAGFRQPLAGRVGKEIHVLL